MKLSFKKWPKWAKNKYTLIGGGLLVLIILIIAVRHSRAAAPFESAEVVKGNVVQTVSVTGTVSPVGKADLAFEKSGSVAGIYVAVGDHVYAGQTLGILDRGSEEANLAAAQAVYDDTARGLRPEEQAAEQATISAAAATLENAEQDALDAIRDGYPKAQVVIANYADLFFDSPQSTNPAIQITTDSAATAAINSKRVKVTIALNAWAAELARASTTPATSLARASSYLATVKDFMDSLAYILNKFSTTQSYTQSPIDLDLPTLSTHLTTINQASVTMSTAQATLNSATAAYAKAKSAYDLKLAGSSPDEIAAQSAKVSAAAAELAKGGIRSPINGIVTKVIPQVGEFVTTGQTAFGVISDGTYKIEAFVPEADIAKLNVGNEASTTLDAYGSDVNFPAKVTIIDPAETVIEGVPTYKVTLQFNTADTRIRSGMTANLDIRANHKVNVVVVPTRAILDDEGKKTVRVVNADGKTYETVPVTTGLRGSEGTTEILSGLKVGQKVVTYIKP